MRFDALDATRRREIKRAAHAAAVKRDPPGDARGVPAAGDDAAGVEPRDLDDRRLAARQQNRAVAVEGAEHRSATRAPHKPLRVGLELNAHVAQPHRLVGPRQHHVDLGPRDIAIEHEPRDRAILRLTSAACEMEGPVTPAIAIAGELNARRAQPQIDEVDDAVSIAT